MCARRFVWLQSCLFVLYWALTPSWCPSFRHKENSRDDSRWHGWHAPQRRWHALRRRSRAFLKMLMRFHAISCSPVIRSVATRVAVARDRWRRPLQLPTRAARRVVPMATAASQVCLGSTSPCCAALLIVAVRRCMVTHDNCRIVSRRRPEGGNEGQRCRHLFWCVQDLNR